MIERLACVITTIQPPTGSVVSLSRQVGADVRIVVVGDTKGPKDFNLPGTEFFSIADQDQLPFTLARLLPKNHYTRKNLGYLVAFQGGCTSLYETDDDNAPMKSWKPRSLTVSAADAPNTDWFNVYSRFSTERIWPRGYPLEELSASAKLATTEPESVSSAPIQQGLADGSPDVDAVWRMTLDKPITFERNASVRLPRGTWCPFNSQSTWWWPVAYPLLYLPSHCSFRMTDIWRSFVAQRCIWELDAGIVFHSAEVFQERNVHNLLNDFRDEVPGYLNNAGICKSLSGLSLRGGPANVVPNLIACYEALVERKYIPRDELKLVEAWVADLAGPALAAPSRP